MLMMLVFLRLEIYPAMVVTCQARHLPGYSYTTLYHGVPGCSGNLYLGYPPILAATNLGYLNRP